jgi:hypothetical protein
MKNRLNIRLWWKFEGRYYHKDFIEGIKNLWKWFPTIWKDRDWDANFIYEIIKVKLEHQAKYIGSRGIHLDANRDAQRMMTCVRLIQRVRYEYYHMEYSEYHESAYHWDDVPERPNNKQLRVEELWENYDAYFKKYPRVYKQVVNDLSQDQRKSKTAIAIRMAWENHHRARKLLFKLLERHIESWWD